MHRMLEFPAQTFIQFFQNHGLLSMNGQHQWYTVTGGSKEYIKRLMAVLPAKIHLSCPAVSVEQRGEKIALKDKTGQIGLFDHVVFASHADETLRLLLDKTPEEAEILGAFHYQTNQAVLHRDVSIMPKRKRCWASWVYHAEHRPEATRLSVTYYMNRLQNIAHQYPLFVTLNPLSPIPEEKIFDQHAFTHPVFTREAIAAQARIPSIQGKRRLWFTGAYQRYGFHEDGLMSAIAVAKALGVTVPWH